MPIITTEDVPEVVAAVGAARAEVMVAGANARAERVAPCLVATDPAPSPGQLAEAALVLIGAVIRWSQAGSGAVSQQTAGPFGITVDNRQKGGFGLWPSEITDLQNICKAGDESGGAFSIDTLSTMGVHAEICAVTFGAPYCSCGSDIAGYPLYENTEDLI